MPTTTFLNFGTTTGGVGVSTTKLQTAFSLAGPGQALDIQLTNANSPTVIQSIDLTSGANTINAASCPALPKAGGVFLIPPSGNSTALTLKGVTGDTGVAMSLTAPTFLAFAVSPPTSFVITTGGAISGFRLAFV